MIPFDQALPELGLRGHIDVLSVPSGYPSPKLINLVLRRVASRTFLFESSAATEEIVGEVEKQLRARKVEALDALLVTHCHGDHAGSSGLLAAFGRSGSDRAPIHLHSAGYRFLTHPEAAFLNETYEIFQTRAHWGLIQYDQLSEEEKIHHELRKRYSGYFAKTPKHALEFVDRARLPSGILAVYTPGHSNDCVLYYDEELRIAVPGDTIITTGRPDAPESIHFVIPIFTASGQSYSMAYERFLETVRVLRRFFETNEVRAVIPPHGRFAVTRPLDWVRFAENYFRGIYRAFLEEFLADPKRRDEPFLAKDLNPFIPSAGAHPVSTPSHTFGMLCALADEGYLALTEHPNTRHITFRVAEMPPPDFVEKSLAKDPGPLPVYRRGDWVRA